jgi:hypothetical protein
MLRSPSRKRTKKAPEQEQLHPNLDTEQPLVFISHDHRDSELAEAFQNLIADASAGVVRCFRSSDRLGTSGIEYGSVRVTAHPPLMCSRHEAAKIALDMVTDDSIHRIRESRHAPHSSQG